MVKLKVQYSDGVWVAYIDGKFFSQAHDLNTLNEQVKEEMDRRIASRDNQGER